MTENELREYLKSCLQPDGSMKANWYKIIKYNKDVDRILYDVLPNFRDDFYTFNTKAYCLLHEITDVPKCLQCGSPYPQNIRTFGKGFSRFCSARCAGKNEIVRIKQKNTVKNKYGDEYFFRTKEYKKQKEEWSIRKYGVANPWDSQEYRDSLAAKSIQKYGVKHVFQLKNIQKLAKEGMMKKYGVAHPMQVPEIKAKIIPSMLNPESSKKNAAARIRKHYENICKDKYVEPLFSLEEYANRKNDQHLFKWRCRKCGNVFEMTIRWAWHWGGPVHSYARCFNCFPKTTNLGKSKEEFELVEFLKTITDSDIIHGTPLNRKIIPPYEIDIFIPSLNIGVEFDGIFWHSVECKENAIEYHMKKTSLCEEKGIRLIHIWSQEWETDRKNVERSLKEIIEGKIDFSRFMNGETIILPREKYNKIIIPDGYVLDHETEPTLNAVKSVGVVNGKLYYANAVYHCPDCGNLVYRKEAK